MSDATALRAFVDELVRAGVREAIVCPGSRSTPLALALRAHPGVRVYVLLDERSAGFFAVGLARAARRPVAILATSGTAVVNFTPAVVEAFHARVPLVVLTADRPPELRDRGAPQTIDQVRLYGQQVKWFAELALDEAGADELLDHVRSVAGRAVATATTGPAGPVHLNLPFREPLLPSGRLDPAGFDADATHAGAPAAPAPFTAVVSGPRTLEPGEVAALARRLASVRRGLIVAGPQDDPVFPEAVARLARATGFPILADPLSQVRRGPHDRAFVLSRGDLIVRPGAWIGAHRPELVLRFGAMPTSKPIVELLRSARPAQVVVDGDGGWREAAILPTTFVHADGTLVARALADALESDRVAAGAAAGTAADEAGSWAADWLAAERAATDAVGTWLAGLAERDEPFEPLPFVHLAELLPEGAVLWSGSSMPVRDLDTYLPSGPGAARLLANRGVNGIDGVVSSALGAAAAGTGRVVLVVGDLSFLHDLNALVAARLHGLTATIVLVNNDGGGIFSFLPQATADMPGTGLPEAYEELFGTPHGVDFGPIVAALGGTHRTVTAADLHHALADALTATGVQVLELRTERRRNVELHRQAARAAGRALDALVAKVTA